MATDSKEIMIIAGEPSGDAHAAHLVAAIRELAARRNQMPLRFFGSTSHALRAAGVEQTVNADEFAIIGLPEILRALPMFLGARRKLLDEARKRRPAAVILVDFPEFNLKIARSLRRLGIPVIYYISPQLWAWRGYRIRTFRHDVRKLLTILPFENDWYRERGIEEVEFVGNPLVSSVKARLTPVEFRRQYKINDEEKIVALLPGSRRKELAIILPEMLAAAGLLDEQFENLVFVVPLAATRSLPEVTAAKAEVAQRGLKLPPRLLVVTDETYSAVAAADVAAVTSGTATLETAIMGTPLVVVYKGSQFNYRLLRPLITVDHFGLVNLVAGRRLATELIQDDLSPERLAQELANLLDRTRNQAMREELRSISESLGDGRTSERAAEIILQVLDESAMKT